MLRSVERGHHALLFFHPWLIVGIGIDVALLVAVAALRWTPAVL